MPKLPNRKRVLLLVAACVAVAAQSAHASVLVTDGEFTAWSFGSHGTVPATATVTQEPAAGNPGARLNITTVTTPTEAAFGTGFKNDFSTNAPLAGTNFTLSLDFLGGPGGFGQGQAIELLVEQNGTVYAMSQGVTGFFDQTNWHTVVFNGVFNAASFTRVIGAGPLVPTFDGSLPMRFGFSGGNLMSDTLTQYYDNFSLLLDINQSILEIPTLSQWGLIALVGMLALAGLLRLR